MKEGIRLTIAIWSIRLLFYLFAPIFYPLWYLAFVHSDLIRKREQLNEREN